MAKEKTINIIATESLITLLLGQLYYILVMGAEKHWEPSYNVYYWINSLMDTIQISIELIGDNVEPLYENLLGH